jgi:putative flippase GtrA
MVAIKNFLLCWVVVFYLIVSLTFSLLIAMPFRFVFNRKTFEWSKEYEADKFVDEILKVTFAFRENVILKRWSE